MPSDLRLAQDIIIEILIFCDLGLQLSLISISVLRDTIRL